MPLLVKNTADNSKMMAKLYYVMVGVSSLSMTILLALSTWHDILPSLDWTSSWQSAAKLCRSWKLQGH